MTLSHLAAGVVSGTDVPNEWGLRQSEEALRSTDTEAKPVEPLTITDYESATACMDHLHGAIKAIQILDNDVGQKALHAL